MDDTCRFGVTVCCAGWCSGWALGSDARRSAALLQVRSIRDASGVRCACASSGSVGVVLSAPVMAAAACLCIRVKRERRLFVPGLFDPGGPHVMSMA